MAAEDGSVEIKIVGSVDPSVAASAKEASATVAGIGQSASVSASTMAAALQAAGGNLKAITPEMLGLAAAQDAVAASGAANAAATATETAATVADTAATVTNTGAKISSRAATESLVLVHELLQNRYSRMTGSAMILAQALAGQEHTASALSAVLNPLGATIAGIAAISVGAAVASSQYEAEQRKLTATSLGLGAASGLTTAQLNAAGEAAAKWSGQSVTGATEAAAAFAAAGVKSQDAVTKLSGDVEIFAELTGQKAAAAQKELADAMRDPVKGAQDLNDKLGILDSTTLDHIRTLSELGDKEGAVAVLVEALQGRMNDAKAAGVGLTSQFHEMVNGLKDVWEWLGKVNSEMDRFTVYGVQFGNAMAPFQAQIDAQNKAIERRTHLLAEMNEASAKGKAAYDSTPEGRDTQQQQNLLKGMVDARNALIADTALRGENSVAVKRDKEALDEYTRAYHSWLPAAEKAHAIAVLDDKIAEARHAHNKQLIEDLTRQRSLVQQSGEVKSSSDVSRAANDAAATARARAGSGPKGPSVVQQWTEQLHAQEIASNDFFRDQTSQELAFWQSKVGLTKAGSKEWLEVQSKIYEASKTLAHQDYQDKLADLNEKIQADRDNWSKQQADWNAKLDFIRAHYTAESAEYKNAHREFEAAERQHQREMEQAQRDGEQKRISQLKSSLQAQRTIRQEDARASEAIINSNAGSSPFGEVKAALDVARLHQQLNQQELADLQSTYAAESALLQQQVNRALSTYTEDSKQYQEALNAKAAADAQYFQQRRALEEQAKIATINDILTVQQRYHSYIDNVVGSTASGLIGVAGYTQTWQQAVVGIYNSVLGSFSQMLTKMASNWIVQHVFMSAAQRAQLAAQLAAHSATETAKTGATTTGVVARSTVENTGFFAKMLGLLGIHLGAHTATEAGKTAATAAGAAARTAEETTALTAGAVAQRAIAASQIPVLAGLAGAGGVASMAAAPWPIDMGAPAFGAAMAAEAAALGAMASLAVGTNYVPNDMIAQIHAGERIIPAADNKAIMTAINDNSRNDVRTTSGDTHNHHSWEYHDHTGRASPERVYENRAALAKGFKQAHREGHFRGFKF